MITGLCIGLFIGGFIGFMGCVILTKSAFDERDCIIRRLLKGDKDEQSHNHIC